MPSVEAAGFQTYPELFVDLLDRIDAVKSADPRSPVVVVAPSGRMLDRIRRGMRSRKRTWIGIELLTYGGLAARSIERGGGDPLHVADPSVLERVLAGVLAGRKDRIAVYARRHAGGLRALHGTMRDLRDAGIGPDRFAAAAGGDGDPATLAAIFAGYARGLARLEREGLSDRAGLVTRAVAALASADPFLPGTRLFHIGAYELLGIHRDLLETAARCVPTIHLLPGISTGPAFAYAAERIGITFPEGSSPRSAPGRGEWLFAGRLDRLGDEASPAPDSLLADRVEIVSVAGARAEVEVAARTALAWHDAGMPLDRIGILARTLEPYAPHLREVFGREGLPIRAAVSEPLLRHSLPRLFRDLLRCLDLDFPRPETARLLASDRFAWERLGSGRTSPGGIERWSRAARIGGGAERWIRDLPAWARAEGEEVERRLAEEGDPSGRDAVRASAGRRLEGCERVAGAVAALRDEAAAWGLEGWREQADRLRGIGARWLRGWDADDPGTIGIRRALDRLEEIDTAVRASGGKRKIDRPAARETFERLLESESIPLEDREGVSVAILDLMRARGEDFDGMILLGLNADQWPQRVRPDPFLSDAARRALSADLGRVLPEKEWARREERLLLAFALGGTRERLLLSIQRADEGGRAKAHAGILREIARLTVGTPRARALLDREGPGRRTVPTDPARRALEEARAGEGCSGMLSASEAAAASGTFPDPIAALRRFGAKAGGWNDAFEAGCDMVAGIQRWEPGELRWDGVVGDAVSAPAAHSASRFRKMGLCPLQYFFERVLHVAELDRPEEGIGPDGLAMGDAVHALLEEVFRDLDGEGIFPIQDVAEVAARARARLEVRFDGRIHPVLAPVRAALPALAEVVESAWREALADFLDAEIARLAREQAVPVDFERTIEADLVLDGAGKSRTIPVIAKLDRIDRLAGGGLRVVDYKTGGDLAKHVDWKEILRGERPQMALYLMLLDRESGEGIREGRLSGIGPEFPDPSDPEAFPTLSYGGEEDEARWRSVAHTFRILAEGIGAGRFPIRPGHHCTWCPYAAACRRRHPPTVHRNETAAPFAALHDLDRKTKTKPFPVPEASS